MRAFALLFCLTITGIYLTASEAVAQSFRFTNVQIEGNQRVDPATILSYAGIGRGETVSAGRLNDAYQSILGSGLFETVEIDPRGNTLVIRVSEFPTINKINIEGNRRLKDDALLPLIRSQSRRVYSPTQAELDAAAITGAYRDQGRLAATVLPKIIRRSDNRVDLVFEVSEGRVVEIERVSFVGNRAFSDRRLRRVLETKQAGLLRQFIRSDTFIADRIEFDKQVLRDFYLSRGYVDFQTLSVNPELTRQRDGFLITFTVQEGQSFDFGEITTVSDLEEIDTEVYQSAIRLRPGTTYSPTAIDNTILRLERLALQQGLNFIRVEPRINRNDRDLTLDVEFEITKGPRIFVERIDIEGNNTTLDRVVRRQFNTVEGDPFNPREIRNSAERIRALGYFETAAVNAREGSGPDQVIVDVDVEEANTGSLSFGASYGQDEGLGFNLAFNERNFLGRGQHVSFSFATGSTAASTSLSFYEPAFLSRDLGFRFSASYDTTDNASSAYDTRVVTLSPGIDFPVSENGRLELAYRASKDTLFNVPANSSAIIDAEQGSLRTSAVSYAYTFDNRRSGLNPTRGFLFSFGQEYGGLGGDNKFLKTNVRVAGETKAFKEEVTFKASIEGGAIKSLGGTTSRVTDRFFNGPMRGFEGQGIGPRDLNAVNRYAPGGNYYAVATVEAQFPLGLPEEYGITGGLFWDVGSVWGLDNTAGGPIGGPVAQVDDSMHLRSVVGFSVFWDTAIGPLRFNFTKALKKESYDKERTFDLTISTSF